MIDLRYGDWRETMAADEVDAVITDPPYSRVTHEGQRSNGTDGPACGAPYTPDMWGQR